MISMNAMWLVLLLLAGVYAQTPCSSHSSGDYCYGGGYVSCPSTTVRPCQAGLVCTAGPQAGSVYCVRPEEATSSSGSAATTGSAGSTTGTTPTPPVSTTSTSSSSTVSPGGPITPPVKSIYMDINCWSGRSSFTDVVDAGYNLLILAFFMSTNDGPNDCALAFEQLSAADRTYVLNYFHSAGAKIIVSTGGASDTAWFSNYASGTEQGSHAATWALNHGLDGVDFDLEWFQSGFTVGSMTHAQTVQWLVDATNAARTIMGPNAIISHAPQPAYFGASSSYFQNGYGEVYARAGSAISYFFVQFYNNGDLNTYDAIFVSGYPAWGEASVSQIAAVGVPLSKIVVGKPVNSDDADAAGYNTAAQLHSFFSQAQTNLGWNTGVMGWQWHDKQTNSAWIHTIYP